MQSWNVRMLTASYRRKEDGVTVEIYGKTSAEESIVVLCPDFWPYFYAVAPLESVEPLLKGDSEIRKLEEVGLFNRGEEMTCTKITMTRPWLVPEYRKRLDRYELLAADIPFGQRFIYDNDLGACFTVTGEKVESYDYTTDLVVRADGFEEQKPFQPNLKILSFDIENSIKTQQIYTICTALREGEKLTHESFCGTEREIILGWVKYIQETDPDIITGYNIDGYDLPMILDRAKLAGIENEIRIGRDYNQPNRVSNRFWRLHGRIIADAWWNVKRELKPKKETLNNVAKILLGEEKDDVDPTKIDQEWQDDQDKVVRYCKKDAELALRVLEEIDVLDKNMGVATVSKLPLDDIINGTTSVMIDSILIREADRRGIGVPMTRHIYERDKIEGGYVHEIVPGLYHWVCVLDFKSMYPSLIISKNICITTLSKEGTIESPEGIRFLTKDVREGIFPYTLERLMRDRDETKRKMKAAGTPEEREYYDRLQNAIKILMNAFYGVLASSFYRFTNPRIGASITAFARENIKRVISQLEEEKLKVVYSDTDSVFFQSPFEELEKSVEYGKKISERFSKGGVTLEFEKVMEPLFSHGKKKRYVGKVIWPNEDMIVRGYEIRRTDSFDLQSDTLSMVFEEILTDNINGAISKSRETIDGLLKGEVPKDKLVISRTVKEAVGKPLFKFALGGQPETMEGFKLDQTVASAFRRNGLSLDPSKDRVVLVSSSFAYIVKDDAESTSYLLQRSGTTVTVYKSSTVYKNPERMTNVQAAIKFIDLGYEFVPGMKVSWIVTDSKSNPQNVEPYVDGREFEKEPDWQYYAKRVAATIARVTEVFDWDEDALLTGSQQQTLFGGRFESKKKEDDPKPNITKKQVSLEDFM